MATTQQYDAEDQEDHFSKLSRDCLLSVFSRVDRETLNEAECLSNGIQSVVKDRSLSRIKTIGKLYIYEQRSGHSFTMNNEKRGYSLSFHVNRDTPTIGVRSRCDKLYDPLYSYQPPDEDTIGLEDVDVIEDGASTTIPAHLFEGVEALLEKHACPFVHFDWIMVDQTFLDRIAMVNEQRSKPDSEKGFSFGEARFDAALDLEKFVAFLLSSKLTSLKIIPSDTNVHDFGAFLQIFNEEFLTKFASPVPDHIAPVFSLLSSPTVAIPHYWTPSPAFLPILCRFRTFTMVNMMLDWESFFRLVMTRLNMDRVANVKKWQFALSEELDEEHLRIFDNEEMFTHTFNDEDDIIHFRHRISKIGTPFYAEFRMCANRSGIEMVQVLFCEEGNERRRE